MLFGLSCVRVESKIPVYSYGILPAVCCFSYEKGKSMTSSPGSTLTGLNQYLQDNSIDSHDLSVPNGTVKVVPAWGARIEFMGAGETNAL